MKTSLAGLLLFVLVACNPTAKPAHDPSGFENPIGKAVVLHLIAETKAAYAESEDIPLALGIGGALRPASAAFLKSLSDEGHVFINADQLDYDRITKATVIKGGRVNPIVFQLSKISQTVPGTHDVEAAWNRNSDVVRKVYRVTGDPDKGPLTVTVTSVIQDKRVQE